MMGAYFPSKKAPSLESLSILESLPQAALKRIKHLWLEIGRSSMLSFSRKIIKLVSGGNFLILSSRVCVCSQ